MVVAEVREELREAKGSRGREVVGQAAGFTCGIIKELMILEKSSDPKVRMDAKLNLDWIEKILKERSK